MLQSLILHGQAHITLRKNSLLNYSNFTVFKLWCFYLECRTVISRVSSRNTLVNSVAVGRFIFFCRIGLCKCETSRCHLIWTIGYFKSFLPSTNYHLNYSCFLKRSVGRTGFLNGMEKWQGTFCITNQME